MKLGIPLAAGRVTYTPSSQGYTPHLGGSAFCNFYRLGVPEQALGGIPLGFGIVIEDKLSELSCNCTD